MSGADAGWGGQKIGCNTNHYMRSHIRGHYMRSQNPLRNKRVQHPFSASASKPHTPNHLCPQEMADPPASAPRMCEHTCGSEAGMSKSARLRSATIPRICERRFRHINVTNPRLVKIVCPVDAHIRLLIMLTLIQLMAFRLFCTKPLLALMVIYIWLDHMQ